MMCMRPMTEEFVQRKHTSGKIIFRMFDIYVSAPMNELQLSIEEKTNFLTLKAVFALKVISNTHLKNIV